MIPHTGSINILGSSGALNTTTITHSAVTGTIKTGSTLLIITSTPVVALDAIRTTTTLFLNLAATANFSAATRVIAQQSPITYGITASSYASGSNTVTLTVDTLPAAPVAGQLIYIENSRTSTLNGTYTLTGAPTTTSLQFTLATNPGTGFVGGKVRPGIVNSVAGTSNGCVGYYTISRPALADVSADTILAANLAKAGFTLPTGCTHVIAQSGTATFANLHIDGAGSTAIPCGQPISIRNLRNGFLATGTTSGTDVLNLVYVSINPIGAS